MTENADTRAHSQKTIRENESPPENGNGKSNRARLLTTWGLTGLLVVIIVLVMVLSAFRKDETPVVTEKKLVNVEVVTVSAKEYRESLVLPALVEADRIASIKPEFPGRLEKWHFKEGDLVEEGQLVASLNIDTLTATMDELQAAMKTAAENSDLAGIMIESAELDLESARKNRNVQALVLESAQSAYNLAHTEFKRIQKLVQRKVLDPSKLDTVRNALRQTELEVARAKEGLSSAELGVTAASLRVKQAKANRNLANARLVELNAAVANVLVKINKSNLRAPISGRLEEHLLEPGEVASAGVPCANIYDLKYLRATVNVPDRFVAFLDFKNGAAKTFIQRNRPGVELQVRAKLIVPGLPKLEGGKEAGLELDAEIAYIAQSTDPESNTFKVELRLPNVGGALRHGVLARAKIEYLFYPQAIVIPVKAVQVTDAGPRVLVVENIDGNQVARIRDIEPLSIRGNEVLIGKGLSKGDRLIVSGWKGLVGGETVNVLFEDGQYTAQDSETGRKSSGG